MPDEPARAPQGSTLIFDGDCGFCTTVARSTARRFRHGERAEAWQLLEEGELERHGLTLGDVTEAAWWVDDSGTRDRGHRAIGAALRADGGLWRLLSWIVLTPPTSFIAAASYRLVVRWRYKLPGGTPACKVSRRAPSP
jgi:predicted DCC family thiol-disulfide oxidoreductase YuxK